MFAPPRTCQVRLGEVDPTAETARECRRLLIQQIVRLLSIGLIHGDLWEFQCARQRLAGACIDPLRFRRNLRLSKHPAAGKFWRQKRLRDFESAIASTNPSPRTLNLEQSGIVHCAERHQPGAGSIAMLPACHNDFRYSAIALCSSSVSGGVIPRST